MGRLVPEMREDARSHLQPQILQCLQRNNGLESSGPAASRCLSFPRCNIMIKTLEGGFLVLAWAWGSINRMMLMVFSPFCYEILLKHLSIRRNLSPEAPSQNEHCARKGLHLLFHPNRGAACGRSQRAGVASGLSP